VEEEDLVVDIGTGSGILSIMAVKAGAEHVFAIEGDPSLEKAAAKVFFFFFTLVTGPRRSLSLKLSDTQVYAPLIRALLGNHNTTIQGGGEQRLRREDHDYREALHPRQGGLLHFFFTLVTGPIRSLSLNLSDTRVYEPQIRARLGRWASGWTCRRAPTSSSRKFSIRSCSAKAWSKPLPCTLNPEP